MGVSCCCFILFYFFYSNQPTNQPTKKKYKIYDFREQKCFLKIPPKQKILTERERVSERGDPTWEQLSRSNKQQGKKCPFGWMDE